MKLGKFYSNLPLLAGVALMALPVSGAVIFTQDFSSSTVVADYVSTTSGSDSLFRDISVLSGTTVNIASNGSGISFTRPVEGTQGNGGFRGPIFESAPKAVLMQFDLAVSGNSTSFQGSVAAFSFGSSFMASYGNFQNDQSSFQLRINLTATANQFSLRANTSSNTLADSTFTGRQTIRWYMNYNAGNYVYSRHDGGGDITLAEGAAHIWVGNNFIGEITDLGTLNLKNLSSFAFAYSGGTGGTVTLDDITVTAVPEPGTYGLVLGLLAIAGVIYRRRRR